MHEGPTPEKFEALRQALAYVGIRLSDAAPSPKTLQAVAAQIADRPDQELLETLILRSMMQARYSPENIGHFGLALPRYMHFTSPIRRYADLVVHRAIAGVVNGHPNRRSVSTHSANISRSPSGAPTKSAAGVADWLKCEYAAQFVGETFAGRVVARHRLRRVRRTRAHLRAGPAARVESRRGLLHVLRARAGLVGERSGRRIKLGDAIEVGLVDVDVETRRSICCRRRQAAVTRSPPAAMSEHVYGFHAVAALLRNDPGGRCGCCAAAGSRRCADRDDCANWPAPRGWRWRRVRAGSSIGWRAGATRGWWRIRRRRSAGSEAELELRWPLLPQPPLLLVLDGVTDPRNLGACLRSADGAGVQAVLLPRRRSAPLSDVALKTAAGGAETR